MTVSVYFPENQLVKINIHYNNLVQRAINRSGPIKVIETTEEIAFFPFNLIQESYEYITVHIYTSNDLNNILFDCFDVYLRNSNTHVKIFVEKRQPDRQQLITIDFDPKIQGMDKQNLAFSKTNWSRKKFEKLFEDDNCLNFAIEICRDKLLVKPACLNLSKIFQNNK